MKTIVAIFCISLFPISVLARARGEEKTYECAAESKSVSVSLKIVLRDGQLAHVSYSSINGTNGSDCSLEIGDQSQQDSSGSFWERWQDITLVHIKDDPNRASETGQILIALKQPAGYRISVNLDTLQASCALHGYLPASVTINLKGKTCALKW